MKIFVFVFYDVAISSFVEYQFQITRMLFVCLYSQDEIKNADILLDKAYLLSNLYS